MARLIGDLMQVFGVTKSPPPSINPNPKTSNHNNKSDEFMIRALTAVFGMKNDGKIKAERARQVVEKLGLMYAGEEEGVLTVAGEEEEVAAEEVMSGLELEGSRKRKELLEEAFKIFDENGNGFIEANEVKRVLECLGLDKGWELSEIEKMMRVVDLNLDGMVDFHEFELMMMS
ncbi:calmodulin-like protein 2 [Euphorbia lathyris]|uniref:calmodulin-like protein 2 n=1 Tax=Euphorbia lathyris TaxID=212925 RepID=UPI00331411A1